jgi:fermentation-respiration switch protein FrsA (DUF1100 family)
MVLVTGLLRPRLEMRVADINRWMIGLALLAWVALTQAAAYERRDVVFQSQGLGCAAWYYVPAGLSPGEQRPAIVMAHGYSGVKEQYLDNFAGKFAGAGFAVLVFDYRYLGASQGEPRQQVLWYEQIIDYRNAITWVSMQPEVDASRIGVWGTSYSGGHVLQVAAFDRRVKAVVAQVPQVSAWRSYFASMPKARADQQSAWFAQARAERMASGKVSYFPVVAPEGQPAVMPQPEAHAWVTAAAKVAPSWENRVTVESLEVGMYYDAAEFIAAIAPTPLLMVIASEDIITPTAVQEEAFARAGNPKQLVVVTGRHFDPYTGPKHVEYVTPQLAWFEKHLMAR